MSSAEVTTASAIAAMETSAQETRVDIATSIDLDSLHGQHQGVLLHKEELDPNQCDREEVIEVL